MERVCISADLVYGSGLRNGFANTSTVSPYVQVNFGLSHEFPKDQISPLGPLTVRFDVVNLLDHSYEIRDGSGVGVFAPQIGPCRGFFAGAFAEILTLKQPFLVHNLPIKVNSHSEGGP